MAKLSFTTVKNTIAGSSGYRPIPRIERILSVKESMEYAANKTGYSAAKTRAAFMALAEVVKENAAMGVITSLASLGSFRNFVSGAFATMSGPWVKGQNMIITRCIVADEFKKTLEGIATENVLDAGVNPIIKTILDIATGVYGQITSRANFSVAGSDLAPDPEADDEGVWLVTSEGVLKSCEIITSELGQVIAKSDEVLTPGEYTLRIRTRAGFADGDIFEVNRKVDVVAAA